MKKTIKIKITKEKLLKYFVADNPDLQEGIKRAQSIIIYAKNMGVSVYVDDDSPLILEIT